MLQVIPNPLPKATADKIRAWLGADGSRHFMEWLATREAMATADAGNKLASDQESDNDEAKAKIEEARFYRRMIGLINEARDTNFEFERCDFRPFPHSTSTINIER